jgi:hypothetical protein
MFIDFAQKKLKLSRMPDIRLVGSTENKNDAFGHIKGKQVRVRYTDRHPIDVMRTLAHELIHWKQEIDPSFTHSRNKEDQANALAGRIMRDFDTKYPYVFRDKANMLNEDGGMGVAAVNCTGPGVQGFDPLLFKRRKPLRRVLKRTRDDRQ